MSAVWLIVVAVVVLVAAAIWVQAAPEVFPLLPRAGPLIVLAADGWPLAVWHRPARSRRFREPVVLCHGLANHSAMMDFLAPSSLAEALSGAGFDCYCVDLRGSGASQPPAYGPWDVSVDDHLALDLPALVRFVRERAGAERVFWVGHSLGGLLGLVGAATTLQGEMAGVVALGAPMFFGYRRRVDRLLSVARELAVSGTFPLQWLAALAAPFAPWVEVGAARITANVQNVDRRRLAPLLANVFAPVWSGVLGQFIDWIRFDALRSADGSIDYREAIRHCDVPTLVCGGSADHLAPPASQQRCIEHLTMDDRTLVMFGVSNGQAQDYGHGDLLVGRRAHEEVYPVVAKWLVARAAAGQPRRGSRDLSQLPP